MMNANEGPDQTQDLFQKFLNNSSVTLLALKALVIQGVAFPLPLRFDYHPKQSIQCAAEVEARYRAWLKSHCPERWN